MLDIGTRTNVVCFQRVLPSRIDSLGCIGVRQTTNILTLCKKMSVGHICNVVLEGLENVCTEWVFKCFFTIKQTVSTSCLVCLKLIFIILFYFTYCIILIWWCCQLCANVRWQDFVGLCLSMGVALCYISGSRILSCRIDFWKICALVI